jgi:hypothetical protein
MLMPDKLREIDWSGAEVKDGAVALPLTGGWSKDWSDSFDGVLALLLRAQGSSAWGEIALTKKAIKVSDVPPGAEDDLRHLLESVVVQVNAELSPQPDVQAGEPEDPRAKQDAEMSQKLREDAEHE